MAAARMVAVAAPTVEAIAERDCPKLFKPFQLFFKGGPSSYPERAFRRLCTRAHLYFSHRHCALLQLPEA